MVVCLHPKSVHSQNFSNGYSFFLPPDDSTTQKFLPKFPAKRINSFISIDRDGHFVANGEPIRFWGVNLTTGSCFPVKSKSPFIAARMRKMGINLVRFHHMDNGWTNNEGTIFLRSKNNTRELDPVALDRLFFLLAEMKNNNVYANINLHVSRTFREGDGVLNADSIWHFAKGITYFDPHLIMLQKEFASQLLTTKNPYTGLAMFEDPVIAMVEITNENTLYGMWKGNQLKSFALGGDIMQRHTNMLDNLWQDFLEEKYAEHNQLEQAWSVAGDRIPGGNQFIDAGFESGNISSAWILELHQDAQATMEATTESPHTGTYAAKVNVTRITGTSWHIQFRQAGLSVKKDSSYVLEFWAKANTDNQPINVGFQRDGAPYTWYGGTGFSLSTDWTRYRLSFTAPEDNQGLMRATINFANETGAIWFDDFSFGKPQLSGFEAGEDLNKRNIQRLDYAQRLFYHPQRFADLAQFYLQIQRNYYKDMYAYLKNEVGIQVPITGTNALVGPSDVFTQQDLDYIDDHAYWNHPRFPNVAWSPTDWTIDNISMLENENMGTMANLFGGLALANKPYTISEYNHPFPNRYQWEMVPVLASYASFHDADGLMFFQYNGGTNDDWEADFIDGFFATHRNNSLMSMSPIYGYAYRQNLIIPAAEVHQVDYDSNTVFQFPMHDNNARWGKYFPYSNLISANHAIRTKGFDAESTQYPDLEVPLAPNFLTNGDQIYWSTFAQVHMVNAPKIQSLTGDLKNYAGIQPDQMKLMTASEEGVVTWMSLDDQPLDQAEYSLLTLNSRIQNSGMVWDGSETVHNQWGNAPTQMLPLEIILKLEILADSIQIFPLDTRGKEGESFVLYPSANNEFEIEIDQKIYKTPWFGIQTYKGATSVAQADQEQWVVSLFPNPVARNLTISLVLNQPAPVWVEVINIQGKTVGKMVKPVLASGNLWVDYPVEDLAPGMYIVRLWVQDRTWQGKFIKN